MHKNGGLGELPATDKIHSSERKSEQFRNTIYLLTERVVFTLIPQTIIKMNTWYQ